MTTRKFDTPDGNLMLCEKHKQERIDAGQQLGVPTDAAAMMMGLIPWPDFNSPCHDCEAKKRKE